MPELQTKGTHKKTKLRKQKKIIMWQTDAEIGHRFAVELWIHSQKKLS